MPRFSSAIVITGLPLVAERAESKKLGTRNAAEPEFVRPVATRVQNDVSANTLPVLRLFRDLHTTRAEAFEARAARITAVLATSPVNARPGSPLDLTLHHY